MSGSEWEGIEATLFSTPSSFMFDSFIGGLV